MHVFSLFFKVLVFYNRRIAFCNVLYKWSVQHLKHLIVKPGPSTPVSTIFCVTLYSCNLASSWEEKRRSHHGNWSRWLWALVHRRLYRSCHYGFCFVPLDMQVSIRQVASRFTQKTLQRSKIVVDYTKPGNNQSFSNDLL